MRRPVCSCPGANGWSSRANAFSAQVFPLRVLGLCPFLLWPLALRKPWRACFGEAFTDHMSLQGRYSCKVPETSKRTFHAVFTLFSSLYKSCQEVLQVTVSVSVLAWWPWLAEDFLV